MDMLSRMFSTLFLLIIFLLFFLPVKDTDFGWHYRCGHEVLNGDTTCLYKNTYTYYLHDFEWAYPRLGYDITLSLVFDNFGFVGVSFLGATMMTIAFGLVFFGFSGSKSLKIILMMLGIFGSWSIYSLGYRSQIVSIFFLAIEIFILRKPRLEWLLPILFAIWANAHPGFFLGPIVFAIYIALNKPSVKKIIIFCLSCMATLVNPYGFRIYEEVLRHLFTPLNTLIAEWVSPSIIQILTIIGILIFSTFLLTKQKTKPGYLFFVAVIFGLMAISARRNLPLFYFVAPLVFLEIIPKFTQDLIDIMMLAVLPIVCLILIGNAKNTFSFDTKQDLYCKTELITLPCQAIDYFNNKKGNIYNTYEWGGYLIWKIPNMKLFVDGRMPAWPTENKKSPYTVFLEILQTKPGWNELLDKYKTDYILVGTGTFLDIALEKNKGIQFGWKEEYRDKTAVIYQKMVK